MIVVVTQVDSVTDIPVTVAPAKNGPKLPELPNLEVLWAFSSEYPTAVPRFVCRADNNNHEAVLKTWTDEHEQLEFARELQAREAKLYEQKAAPIRQERNRLLKDSDIYMIVDYPIGQEGKQAWALYRQALRDITSQETFPDTVTWPDKPEVS